MLEIPNLRDSKEKILNNSALRGTTTPMQRTTMFRTSFRFYLSLLIVNVKLLNNKRLMSR